MRSSVDDVEAREGKDVRGLDTGNVSEVLVERDSLRNETSVEYNGRSVNERQEEGRLMWWRMGTDLLSGC